MPELPRITLGPRVESATLRVAVLAATQSGVITRAQLLDLGLTDAWIWRATRSGRLHPIHPGVYAVGHTALSIQGRLVAALLSAGDGAALSHFVGLWWWALLPYKGVAGVRGPLPRRIDISAPGRCSSTPGLRIHHPRRLDITVHDGLAVTTVARTLLDVAGLVSFSDLRLAVAEAEYRKLIDLGELAATLGRGRPGSAALRRALDRHLPQLARAKSKLERRFIELCERYGIPLPGVNVKVAGFRVDALWHEQRLAVELDSRSAHEADSRVEADRRRDVALRAVGYTVHRYTWHQVTRQPELVVADLRAALHLPR